MSNAPAGLPNLGTSNLCAINSALQALSASDAFVAQLLCTSNALTAACTQSARARSAISKQGAPHPRQRKSGAAEQGHEGRLGLWALEGQLVGSLASLVASVYRSIAGTGTQPAPASVYSTPSAPLHCTLAPLMDMLGTHSTTAKEHARQHAGRCVRQLVGELQQQGALAALEIGEEHDAMEIVEGINMRRASVAAAASAASLVLLRGEDQQHPLFSMPLALCEQHAQQDASPEARLKRWLESRGCQLSNVEVRPSTVGEESGFGLFVAPSAQAMHSARKRWWWPFGSPPPFATVATFPMSNAITAENILADPQVGGRFGYLLEHGALNERDIIIGHIAVERARGAKSPLAPWIDMLPKESHSPLSWTEAELDELQGTTLYAAAGTLKRRLAASWSEMQPVLQAVASQSGTERNPSFADLLWAHCVFWSRGHSLPVPKKEGAASSLVAKDPKGAPSFMHVHEGLVPGLDFANHSDIPQCWWEVSTHPQASPPRPINSPPQPSTTTTTNTTTSTSSSTGSTHSPSISAQKSEHSTKAGEGDSSRQLASSILLQLHRGATVAPGDELCINYGDTKSNEELLLLYGFVYDPAHTPVPQHSSKSPGSLRRRTHLPGCNPADFSMIACPLAPASEWDELMQRRMQLLMCQGLKPQFFLAASGVDASAAASGKPTAPVPIDVLETLEVFVLEPEEVDERLEAVLLPMAAKEERRKQGTMPPDSSALLDLKALSHRLDKKKISPQEAATLARQLGLRMAAVSAFVGLLELRMAELEAPQVPSDASLPAGTGPLEADLALLDQHCQAMESRASAATPQTQQQQQQQQQEKQKGGGVQGVQQHSGVQPLLHRKHCAVVYRAGQKQIVRAYAVGAREELSQVMRLQRAVSDLQSRGS